MKQLYFSNRNKNDQVIELKDLFKKLEDQKLLHLIEEKLDIYLNMYGVNDIIL